MGSALVISKLLCPSIIKYKEIVSVEVKWMAVGVTVPDEEVHPDSKGMSICVTCPGVTEKVV